MQMPYSIYKLLSFGSGQIRYVLPRKHWEGVVVRENSEPMVSYEGFFLRKTVREKLDQVKQKLPKGIHLKILDGYRSLEQQQQVWDRKWKQVVLENPHWSVEQVDAEVCLIVARPVGVTNHICGGAVDVCFIDEHGTMIDCGTEYAPADETGRKKCPMFSKYITKEQKQNRKKLREAMRSTGFVYYPGEWWHYCYGDRMWAVYTGKRECLYGPVQDIK